MEPRSLRSIARALFFSPKRKSVTQTANGLKSMKPKITLRKALNDPNYSAQPWAVIAGPIGAHELHLLPIRNDPLRERWGRASRCSRGGILRDSYEHCIDRCRPSAVGIGYFGLAR